MQEPTGGWMPLTLPQLDFWEEFALHPDEPLSTVAHCLDIEGDIDGNALREAISRTIGEAEVLSCLFRSDENGASPAQSCDAARMPQLRVLDLRTHADPYGEAMRLMEGDVAAPLDLTRDPLSAQWLVQVGENRFLWYIRAHHIILDGFGVALIEHRAARLYAHLRGSTDAGHPFHAYTAFLAEEEDYRAGTRHSGDAAYWRDYLAGTRLPVVRKDDEGYRTEGMEFDCRLPASLSADLRRTMAATSIGWPDLLVLLCGIYLHRHFPPGARADSGALPIWLPFMSRWGSVGAHTPAMLVNILPVLVKAERNETLAAFLKRMAGVLRTQRMHGRYRVEQIALDNGVPARSRYQFSPLINVLPFGTPRLPGCSATRHILANGPGDGFEITFRSEEDASDLHLALSSNPAVMAPDAFARHCRDLPAWLRLALAPGSLPETIEHLCGGVPA